MLTKEDLQNMTMGKESQVAQQTYVLCAYIKYTYMFANT